MSAPQHIKNGVQVVDEMFVNDFVTGVPITGILDGQWTKELYNPAGAEVSGAVTVTVTELGASGIYRVTWTPNATGSWVLRLTYSLVTPVQRKGAEYQCYNVDPGELTSEARETLVDDVWDEPLTAATHHVPTSSGRRLRQMAGNAITTGTAVVDPAVGINQIMLNGDASTENGAYDPAGIVIAEGTGLGQCRYILAYDGATKIATVDRNWKTQPDGTSEYVIYGHPGREHVNEGLARGGTADTITLNALASPIDNAYRKQTVYLRSGHGEDQARTVVAYDGTTKIATICHDWDVIPNTTTGYVMLPVSLVSEPDIVDAVWDEAHSAHVVAGSFGELLSQLSSSLQEALGLAHKNVYIDSTVFDSEKQITSARIRVFDTKNHALAATPGGVGEVGELAIYTATTTWQGAGEWSSYRVVRDS